MDKHKLSATLMILFDWMAAVVAWAAFYLFRKMSEVGDASLLGAFNDNRFWQAVVVIPVVWLIAYWSVGSYRSPLYKTRLGVIQEAIFIAFCGSIGLLLLVLSDDIVSEGGGYVHSFTWLLLIHITTFVLLRMIGLQLIKVLISGGVWDFNTIFIGMNYDVLPSYFRSNSENLTGLNIESISSDVDVVVINKVSSTELNRDLHHLLGRFRGKIILLHETLLDKLSHEYHVIPAFTTSYLKIFTDPLTDWQAMLKRIGDVLISFMSLVALSPLMLWIYVKVKSSSDGDALYRQERIGRHGVPFRIIKFRSMYASAEDQGPALASAEDDRCTPYGAWLRRWRLDELPQFFNVIKGDMSIVGPRPERAYYADQLTTRAPSYPQIWRVRPGITSWGQIRYGYASNIEEMLKRYRYDALYMERMGPLLDLRILWYTMIVLLQGKGR